MDKGVQSTPRTTERRQDYQNTYVCSKHFMNGCGPTPTYPDPIPQTTSTSTPKQSRLPPKNKEIFKGQSCFSDSENHAVDEAQSTEPSQHVISTCEGTSICTQNEEKFKCMG